MIIGVCREKKNNEFRVALTPAAAKSLVDAGHQVLIEQGAGEGSGFEDDEYAGVGALIVPDADTVFQSAELLLQVKEPDPSDYDRLKPGQILFAYLHLAADPGLTRVLLERQVTAIGYETVQLDNNSLPLLTPMSEIAGRMALQVGAQFLERTRGGRGVLLGGVPGVPPADVVILGGGVVGTNAAKVAIGLGARVTIIDINIDRLRYLDDMFGGRVTTLYSNPHNIAGAVRRADLLIGAALVPGAKAPQLVTDAMVASMKPGAVIIDVAIDQGGAIATCDRTTTHSDPVYVKHGVLHYAVPNMPGAVPRTSTVALSNATLPYVLELANSGLEAAIARNRALARGVNTYQGAVTHAGVASAHGLEYTPLEKLLDQAHHPGAAR